MSDIETIPPAAPHNACHRQCVASAREAALWAALAGLELMAQKLFLPHGAWMAWVAAHCEFHHRTANNYLLAAQRAIATLGEFGLAPSEADENTLDLIKRQIGEMLALDHLDETRAALIAGIRPPPERKPACKTLARPRAPRPAGPRGWAVEAVPKLIERFRLSPPEVRRAFFEANREEALAFLVP